VVPNTGSGVVIETGRRTSRIIAAALILSAFGFTGCGVINAVKNVAHALKTNKDTIDAFTNKMTAGQATTFVATYVTTGASPTTVVYAVAPPRGLAFTNSPSGSTNTGIGGVDVVANSSGEYSCLRSSSASGTNAGWSCAKLGPASIAAQNKVFDFYTSAHWVAFLKGFSLTAAFAGDTVTSSAMTVNGFSTQCVDFHAPGVPGTSTICTTAQGILGYVKVASDSTSFEITRYSTSPPASLFQLPAGAKVTTVPTSIT